MKRMVLAIAFSVGALAGVLGSRALDAQEPPAKVAELLRTDLAGMEGKEVIVQLLGAIPGAGTGKHYHPGHEVAYILEGSAAFQAEGSRA